MLLKAGKGFFSFWNENNFINDGYKFKGINGNIAIDFLKIDMKRYILWIMRGKRIRTYIICRNRFTCNRYGRI